MMEPRREKIKLSCSNEYLCFQPRSQNLFPSLRAPTRPQAREKALGTRLLCFETNNSRTWSSRFYFHMAFLVVKMLNQRQQIKYA